MAIQPIGLKNTGYFPLSNDRQAAIRTKLKRNLASVGDYYSTNALPVNSTLVVGGSTCSILHYLAAHGHTTELEFFCSELLKQLRDPVLLLTHTNVLSSERKSPLHLAIEHDQIQCIKVLVRYGANLWLKTKVANGFREYMNAIDLAHISGNFKIEIYLRNVEKEQEAIIMKARKKLMFVLSWERGRLRHLPKSIIRHTIGFI